MVPEISRVSHPLRLRTVTVAAVERPTPRTARVTLAGDELEGFVSASPDDHVKVFFPAEGRTAPTLPTLGPDGPVPPAGEPPSPMRDYTPLAFDPVARTLTIELALHGTGVGARWAERAKPGDVLGIGGPRGSTVVADAFAGYLLVGDASSLPSFLRRAAELPEGARAVVVCEVAGPEEERAFPAGVDVRWIHHGDASPGRPEAYLDVLKGLALPPAPFFTWISAEEQVVLAARGALADRGVPAQQMIAKAYWKRG